MSADDIQDLEISGNSICVNGRCYPKLFEPGHDWQPILPGQELPGGLNIRINMETGLKEAKLNDEESVNNNDSHELVISSEDTKASPDDYEFSSDFKEMRNIIDSHPTLSSHDISILEDKFDRIMEFAHDYKHGYKIITHEFALLANVSLNENLPLTLRELSTRVITSCLRTVSYTHLDVYKRQEQQGSRCWKKRSRCYTTWLMIGKRNINGWNLSFPTQRKTYKNQWH